MRPGIAAPMTVDCDAPDPAVQQWWAAGRGFLERLGWPEPWWPVWCATHHGVHGVTLAEFRELRLLGASRG